MGFVGIESSYAAFFNEDGHLDAPKFESWVAGARLIMGIRTDNNFIKRLTSSRHTNKLDDDVTLERYLIRQGYIG